MEILATYRGFATTREEFIGNLNKIVESNANDPNRVYVFAGDINIDLLDTDSRNTIHYITMMGSSGFVSIVNSATRKVSNSKSCLDHKFTDHDPILLNLHLQPNTVIKQRKYTYQYIDHDKIDSLLEQERWENGLCTGDPNIGTNNFIDSLKSIISASTTTKTITCKKRRIKPWISAGLLVSIRTRDKLKKECVTNNKNLALLTKYK